VSNTLPHQRGHRAEPFGEQLLPELDAAELGGHHGHQSGGRGGQSSAGVRAYRKVRLRCRALARTSGCTE